jgi:hypothetical protein
MKAMAGGSINPGGQVYAPPNQCQGLRKSGQRQAQRLLRVFINCTCLNAARPLTFILGFAGMAAKGLTLRSNAMGRFESILPIHYYGQTGHFTCYKKRTF